MIIIAVVAIATISAITGLRKGIQFLSNLNVIITLVLIVAILILGPGGFILDTFLSATGVHLQEFLAMSTFRGDSVWLGSWTIFFWGWFLGYGHPPKSLRVFWAIIMGTVAIVLLMISEGGIEAIQSFIVVTAMPVSLLLLPTFWAAPKAAKIMYEDQFGVRK